ncbi:hypothetical protein NHQ30_001639 [Ciborinia camelliae]|nr:hypothetical protein NHQ30_001639 [Ciborinia camelliae]
MDSSKGVHVDNSAIDVDFGVEIASSRNVSNMRPGSALSSTAHDSRSRYVSLSASPSTPETPSTPAKKRPLEESELSWTDRETFNTSKRHTGVPLAAFRSMHANASPLLPGTVPQAINLDEEEDFPAFKLPEGAVLIDLEDYEREAELEKEIFDIEPQIAIQDNIQRASLAKRNPKVVPPNIEIESLAWKSSFLKPGKTVELGNGTFLKIKLIVKNLTSDDVSIRGWKLVRTRDFILGGMIKTKRNELAFIHEVDRDDRRDVWEQSVHTIRLDEIVKIRRLICTNRPFPECRYRKEDIPAGIAGRELKEILKYVEDEMLLVARWAFVARYSDTEARVKKSLVVDRPRESAILRSLNKKEECTDGEFVEPDIRKLLWRGDTVLGGSGNINNGDNSSNTSSKYTYGDGYCGAGGMTVGAAAAGLDINWGFDFNSHAGLTWQKNFPSAKFHHLAVDEFAALPDPRQDLLVDILHLSPPCQVFSPAHTVPGQNDDMNYASLFGVEAAIKKARPRIVTLEQTFGIMHPINKPAFNGVIRCYTDLGFDVSWQVVKFQGYGTPSRRTRLIIIAACPGETLPHMPQYTYTDPLHCTPSKKPYRTPNQALSSIPDNAPNHDPQSPQLHRANYVPWDGSVICGCIMTSGGNGLGLPNGSRGMTNRELAALQGFPLKHVFHGQEIRKQIGNAVPPIFGKVLLGSVRRHLERRDGLVRGEVIVVSSDEE